MKTEVKTTSIKQTGNKELGTNDKTLYYLIIGEGENKVIVNIGEKTFNNVNKLTGGK